MIERKKLRYDNFETSNFEKEGGEGDQEHNPKTSFSLPALCRRSSPVLLQISSHVQVCPRPSRSKCFKCMPGACGERCT